MSPICGSRSAAHRDTFASMPLRILIATNMFPTPDRPYLGVFVAEQARALEALGHTVRVCAHVAGGDRLNYLRGLRALVRALRTEPFDVIHSHHTYSTILALAARRLAGRRAVPLIETFHESEIFARGTDFKQSFLRRLKYSRGVKAFALRRVDFAIPVQRDMLRVVLGAEGAARVPHAVIPAGIDLARFAAIDRAAARARLGWDPAQTIVLYPCDPAKPEKRADLARAGFALFARDHAGPAQLIVGGAIAYSAMPNHIAACDVVLVPTDYEASPTVVKEALACDRPVVSTDVGDVREAYGDLPGVFICDWNAQSVAAQLHAALRAPAHGGSRERLLERGLTLEATAARVVAVYERLLERAR